MYGILRAVIAISFTIVVLVSFNDNRLNADVLTGVLYEIGSQRKTVLYHWEMSLTPQRLPWKSIYRTPDGKIAAWDKVIWEAGRFREYRYERKPINESGRVILEKNTLRYRHAFKGSMKTATEEFSENYFTGPLVILHIQKNWNRLVDGEKEVVRYGVIDQKGSFEFSIVYDPSHALNDSRHLVFKMEAKSFFVRLFTKPIYFVYQRSGREISGIIGRMLPVGVGVKGMFPIDAELVINRD